MNTLATASDDARQRAWSMPLEQIDPSDPALFEDGSIGHYFERLRNEDPVHRTHSPMFGDFWSVTRYQDIMAVDTNHAVYSSDWRHGGIFVVDRPVDQRLQTFITMDPPQHDEHRKAVSPIVAPANLASMESLIRERTCKVLDCTAAQPDLRLGGQGVDRTDHADAGHAVRLSARRPQAADTLVRHRHQRAGAGRQRGRARGRGPDADDRADEDGAVHDAPVERARQRAAAHRPDLDAGAQPGHAPHDAAGIHGQLRAADRRWQRHHAQLDERRPARDARQPRASGTSCAPTRRWWTAWCPRSSAGRRRWRTCAAPRWPTPNSRASPSARATRW